MYLVIAVYQSQASLWRSKYQELQKKRRKTSTWEQGKGVESETALRGAGAHLMWPPPRQEGWWTGPRRGRWFWFWWKPCGCQRLWTRSWPSSPPSSRKGESPGEGKGSSHDADSNGVKSQRKAKHGHEHEKGPTHNFPVPPCWPVGSSKCRSPPLEYISTTSSQQEQKGTSNSWNKFKWC